MAGKAEQMEPTPESRKQVQEFRRAHGPPGERLRGPGTGGQIAEGGTQQMAIHTRMAVFRAFRSSALAIGLLVGLAGAGVLAGEPAEPPELGALDAEVARLRAAGKYAEAVLVCKQALAIREALYPPDHMEVARDRNMLAGLYRAQARLAEAEPLYRQALAVYEKALGPNDPETATVINNLGLLCKDRGKYDEAEALLRRALSISETRLPPGHPSRAYRLNNLGNLLVDQGKFGDAEPLLRRALAIFEKASEPNQADTATTLQNLAVLCRLQGRYAEAESLFGRALAIEEAIAPHHPGTARTLNNLANVYRSQGRYGDAEALLARALDITEKTLGPDHPSTACMLHNLGDLYREGGKYAEAEPLLRRALAIFEKNPGPRHPDTADTLHALASLCREREKYAEAEPLYRRALAIREEVLRPGHPDIAASLADLAVLCDLAGRYLDAEPLYRRALAIYEKVLGPDHPVVAGVLKNLGHVCFEKGDAAGTWDCMDRAHRILLRARRTVSDSPMARAAFLSVHSRDGRLTCLARALGRREDSLLLLEQERALGLRDLLAEAHARAWAPLPPEDQERLSRARARMNALASRVEKQGSAGRDTASCQEELRRAEMDYDAVMAELRKTHEHYVATETASALDSEQIARSEALRDGAAILGWVEYRDWAWGYVARREGVFWENLAPFGPPKEVESRVRRVVGGLSRRDPAPVSNVQADLVAVYRSRVQPLERHLQGIRRVVVIAQGWAAVLPLEALLTEDPAKAGGGSVASARWLADRYTISYAPSATTLDVLCRHRAARGKPRWERPLFALADPPFSAPQLAAMQAEQKAAASLPAGRPPAEPEPGKEGIVALRQVAPGGRGTVWDRLPGTRREAEALAALLGREKSLVFLGPEASERKLFEASERGELAKCRYVHLATHGLADAERPELSALVLAQTPEDAEYDGALQMREVFHLKLNADLAVLSACQTGLGKQLGGEGMVGLSTAFFFAGTPSLVVSLWNVPDISTVLLMRRFYANLAAGQEKSAALREAKGWLRNLTRGELAELSQKQPHLGDLARGFGGVTASPKGTAADDRPFAHPYYWAPFVLTGDPR